MSASAVGASLDRPSLACIGGQSCERCTGPDAPAVTLEVASKLNSLATGTLSQDALGPFAG